MLPVNANSPFCAGTSEITPFAYNNSNALIAFDVSLHIANVLAARLNDYNTNDTYKQKIDVLTEILLSQEVSDYVNEKYDGAITCDKTSQIDLRK